MDYGPIRATAQQMISEFGYQAVLVRAETTGGGGTEFDPDPGETVTTEYPIMVVDLNSKITPVNRQDATPLQTHTLLIAPEVEIKPSESDRIRLATGAYGIAEVREVAPGGLTLLYEVDLAN